MKKILMIAILMATFLFGILPMVSATTTLVLPAAGNNETGTMVVNCTTDVVAMLNSSIYYNASGGTGVMHATAIDVNSTDDEVEFYNAAWDISGLTDSMTYNLTCYVENLTDSEFATALIGITLDSTDPVCDVEAKTGHLAWKQTQQISWTSSDVVSLVSTAVTVDGPKDQVTLSYTDANKDLTLTSQDTKYLGDWTVSVTGTDRSGNTCTATDTFKTHLPDKDGEIYVPEPKISKGTWALLLIGAAVVYFAFIKKK